MPSRISASNPEPAPSLPACQIALDPTVGLKPNLKIPDCEISNGVSALIPELPVKPFLSSPKLFVPPCPIFPSAQVLVVVVRVAEVLKKARAQLLSE